MKSTRNPTLSTRALGWFRGVSPAYLAKHPNETTYLATQAIAMILPMMMGAFNGWHLAREGGVGAAGAIAAAFFATLLIYGTERVLLQLVGGGGLRTFFAIPLRLTMALCLAVLLGEGFATGILFKDPIAAHYLKLGEAEIARAESERSKALKSAMKRSESRLKPFTNVVDQMDKAVEVALVESRAAQEQELGAQKILLDEEEGRSSSGLVDQGRRWRQKKVSYYDPAKTRLDSATSKLKAVEELQKQANAELRKAVEREQAAGGEIKLIEEEYRRKVAGVTEQSHRDLGSRFKAILALSKEDPIFGVLYLLVVVFFICIDLGAVLLKTLGRKAAFDLEEEHEDRLTRMAMKAELESFTIKGPQLAEMRCQTALRGAISQSALDESLGAIREAVAYQEEIARQRTTVLGRLEDAESKNLPDMVALCRKTLESIDQWAERGLRRSAEAQSSTATPPFQPI